MLLLALLDVRAAPALDFRAARSTTQFFGPTVPVTVTSLSQRVLVISSNGFGTSTTPAHALNLFICYQQPPNPVVPVANGVLGLSMPAGTTSTQGMSRVLQLPPGSYVVGMCGTGAAGWNNNTWGSTSVVVF